MNSQLRASMTGGLTGVEAATTVWTVLCIRRGAAPVSQAVAHLAVTAVVLCGIALMRNKTDEPTEPPKRPLAGCSQPMTRSW